MTDLFDTDPATQFEPTLAAALARVAAVRPGDYARTRNHLDGAVTRLSPYLTHGFLCVPDAMRALRLPQQHKLAFEFGWREFFHHAWRHDGDAIFQSLHPGPLSDDAYARELPADIREGRTGVPAIDAAVRALYADGYVHNHARMWLASYVVHLRKVHWRAGADWLYAHLLDGDLASNHLSWQWVAGTGSHKPYLFNAENVARYAPPEWHSEGTAVDAGYDVLDGRARSPRDMGAEPGDHEGVAEPAVDIAPPGEFAFTAPDADAVRDRDVWLAHPWSLAHPPHGTTVVAVLDAAFHRAWPWSKRRWRFVATRLAAMTPLRWIDEQAALQAALTAARRVRGIGNLHLGQTFARLDLAPMPRAFNDPPRRCRSFSAFWVRAQPSSPQPDLFPP
jgi:deoxyribodipyrimidine photo-lyase